MVTKNSIDSNIPIEISKGGTNATSFSTATGLVKYDGTRLVTSSTALLDASNRLVNSAQPAFLAYLNSSDLNVTGDGSTYTLGGVTALTEIYDQGNNFNTNGTFTAPVTGKYVLIFNYLAQQATTAMSYNATITTTKATYVLDSQAAAYAGNTSCSVSVLADMDAGDTAICSFSFSGATKVVDAYGAAGDRRTSFCGFLAC